MKAKEQVRAKSFRSSKNKPCQPDVNIIHWQPTTHLKRDPRLQVGNGYRIVEVQSITVNVTKYPRIVNDPIIFIVHPIQSTSYGSVLLVLLMHHLKHIAQAKYDIINKENEVRSNQS